MLLHLGPGIKFVKCRDGNKSKALNFQNQFRESDIVVHPEQQREQRRPLGVNVQGAQHRLISVFLFFNCKLEWLEGTALMLIQTLAGFTTHLANWEQMRGILSPSFILCIGELCLVSKDGARSQRPRLHNAQ